MARCFCIQPEDNVATMLDDAREGIVEVLGEHRGQLTLLEPVALGHKVALRDFAIGQPVVKFGVTIGMASRDIRAGQWVHLHNCTSLLDQRSQTLDLHTGAATDTKYD